MEAAARYRIERLIKRGGMAEVFEGFWLAEGGIERRVAIKRMLADASAADESFAQVLIEEARIASQLHHPGVVGVLDYGVLDGHPFLALEYVDGPDLSELIEEERRRGRRVPVEIALVIASEIAHALAYAHGATGRDGRGLGIVHRDVSPGNVLVSSSGDVKLTDFGIALALGRRLKTEVGVAKGKLEYMAPEQLEGGWIDGRADIFALGCVLHVMIAGTSPMRGREIAGALAPARPVIDPSLPADARAIVARAVSVEREGRYSDAKEMARALGDAALRRSIADRRSSIRDWVLELSPDRAGAAAAKGHPLDQLFELDLESEGAPIRRFVTVASAPAPLGADTPATEVSAAEVTVTAAGAPSASGSTSDSASTDGQGPADEASAPPEELIGAVVHGWRIEQQLGQGYAARVYRASHRILKRQCALKVLKASGPTDPRVRRLVREAKILSEIDHPNIVRVVDCGTMPGGAPFLAMELLEGPTLRQLIAKDGALSPARAAGLARQIAAALAEAHRRGLVHRDLKPANVMIVRRDGAELLKVLDFGIARPPAGETRLTAPDRLLGTPAYMAPEQIAAAAEVGPPADLYSLGAVLYVMLAGRPPFRQSTLEGVIEDQLYAEPEPLPDAQGLETIAMQLLEKDPERRPASAEAVIAMIDALGLASVETGATTLVAAGAHTGARPRLPSRSVAIIAAIAIGGALGIGFGVRWIVDRGSAPAVVVEAPAGEPIARAGGTGAEPRSAGAIGAGTIGAGTIGAEASKGAVDSATESGRGSPATGSDAPAGGGGPGAAPTASRARRSAATSGQTRPPADPLRRAELEAEVARALTARGVSLDEIREGDGGAAAIEAWRAAVRGRDPGAARTATDALLARIEGFVIRPEALKRRLSRIGEDLRRAASAAPQDRLERLETQYIRLETSLRPGGSDRSPAQLLSEIRALEADVRALLAPP